METTLFEHCVVELKTDTRNIFLVSGYRPPNCNARTFLKEYNTLIVSLKRNKHHEIIIGIDHNLDLSKTNSHSQTNEFLESNLRKGLIPCISKPTRITHKTASLIDNIIASPITHKTASLIDNIIASPIAHSNHSPYILVEDISGHLPIVVKFRNLNKSLKGQKTVKHRKLDALAFDKINQDISGEN